MSETLAGNYVLKNPFVLAAMIICLLIFLAAYYFVRKSLQSTEYFDSSILKSMTSEDKENSLDYCISFFNDAYESGQMPMITDFMELRINAAAVFTFFRNTGSAARVFVKLKNHYYKKRPLPDFTEKYMEKLTEDDREGDVNGAFCLYGCEEFSKLLDQAR